MICKVCEGEADGKDHPPKEREEPERTTVDNESPEHIEHAGNHHGMLTDHARRIPDIGKDTPSETEA